MKKNLVFCINEVMPLLNTKQKESFNISETLKTLKKKGIRKAEQALIIDNFLFINNQPVIRIIPLNAGL